MVTSKIKPLVIFLFIVGALVFCAPGFASAATRTWDGGGGDNNWSTAANWSTDTAPVTTDAVVFDSTSTKNCTIDNVGTWSGGTLNINSGYTGTVTQSVAFTSGTFTQGAGTFTGGSQAITVSGDFSLSAGTFTSTSGTLSVSGTFNRSGGTFTHNSGTVMLNNTASKTLTNSQNFNNLIVNDGLVGYWKLDEGSGSSATDSSGYGNTGTLTNSPTYSSTVPTTNFYDPYSMSFNGSNNYVLTAIPSSLSQYTISFWAKITTQTVGAAVVSDSVVGSFVQLGGGSKPWQFNNAIDPSASSTGVWVYITAVQNSTTQYLYKNGSLVNSAAGTATLGSTINIGRRGDGVYFNGNIDDVRIYNKALSLADITNLYATTAPPAVAWDNSGLVGYWKFDNNANDSSGNGYNGTANNSPTYSATVPATNFYDSHSITLNGSNQTVTVSDTSALRAVGAVTVSAWIKTSGSNDYSGIIHKFSSNNGYDMALNTSGGVRADFGNGSTYISPFSTKNVEDGSWHLVTATYDGSTAKIYVDGNIGVTTASGSGYVTSSTTTLTIGNDPTSGSRFFNGSIDDVRVYNRALSATDIINLYNTTNTVTLAAAVTVTGDLTINSGTLSTSSSNYAIGLAGSWLNNGGFFTPGTGTVTLNGTASGKEILTNGQSFYALTVNGSGGVWTQDQNVITANDFTITAGTVDARSSYNYSLTVGGNFSNAGTYTARSGMVVLNATTTGKTITTGGSSFYDLFFNGVGGGWTLQDATTVTNQLNLVNGVLSAGSQTLTLSGAPVLFSATGGTITTSGGYTIHTFTSSGTFTPVGNNVIDALVVAGGGAGGGSTGGGGGAGGMLVSVGDSVAGRAYSVTVGAGGTSGATYAVPGNDGAPSIFNIMASIGGGGGAKGAATPNGRLGGSGGGGDYNVGAAGARIPYQGNIGGIGRVGSGNACSNNGYTSGGGGGASGVGQNGSASASGNGGAGTSNSYSGAAVTYAGGGGGGADNYRCAAVGAGGSGGGGNGGTTGAGSNGTANTGGGGGGGGDSPSEYVGGAGGSGIVIIRYLTPPAAGMPFVVGSGTFTAGTGTVVYSGNYASATTPVANVTYNNLTFNNASETYELTANTTVSGNLTITAGTLDTKSGSNYNLTVGGAWSNSGTFTARSGTVLLNNTSSQTLTPGSSSFNNLVVNDGLVGYWKLDNAATDSSGYGNATTLTGDAAYSSTVPTTNFYNPNSVTFDGTGDYLNMAGTTGVADNLSAFSVSQWVYVTANANNLVMKMSNYTSGAGWLTYLDASRHFGLTVQQSSGNYYDRSTTGALNTSQWYHLVATYSAGTIHLYVDGTEPSASNSNAGTVTTFSNSVNLQFGNSITGSSHYFTGKADDLRIYNRALSSTDAANLAATTAPAVTTATTTLAAAVTVAGDLTINSGTLSTSGSNYAVNVAGSWLNNGGVFTSGTGTVTLNGTASGKELLSGGQSFYALTVNGSGGVWTQDQNVTTTNNFTITAGTVDARSSYNYGLTVGNNFSNSGTYTARSGTVTLNGVDQTISGTNTFYNLTKAETTNDSTNSNLTFPASVTTTITGALTLNGLDSNDKIAIISSSNGVTATIDFTGSSTFSTTGFLSVKDNTATDNSSGITLPLSPANSTNVSNTTGWFGAGTAAYEQTYFRFYNDSANPAGLNNADPYAAQNTNYNPGPGTIFRLRIEIANTGSAAGNIVRRLEFKEDAGAWTQITTGTNNVRLADSTNFTDAAATTSRLTATGSFQAGQGKDTGSDTSSLSLTNGNYTEDEFSLKLESGASGHTYTFRITNAGTPLDTYTVTPGINTVDVTPPVPSGFNPATTSTIKTATPNITFNLDEAGDCKASTTNASYAAMTGANCTGDGSTSGACLMPSLGSNGSKTIYFACQDTWGNQDSSGTTHSVTYTLNLSSGNTPSFTIKGNLKVKGNTTFK